MASYDLHIRLPHTAITRAPGLLPMLYRPAELAEELGVPVSQVHRWVKQGLPSSHDKRGHLWIIGTELASWIETMRQLKHKSEPSLAGDEAYCVRCRKPVKLDTAAVTIEGRRALLTGICPECGSPIYRAKRHD